MISHGPSWVTFPVVLLEAIRDRRVYSAPLIVKADASFNLEFSREFWLYD
jgi:hypothetical protein